MKIGSAYRANSTNPSIQKLLPSVWKLFNSAEGSQNCIVDFPPPGSQYLRPCFLFDLSWRSSFPHREQLDGLGNAIVTYPLLRWVSSHEFSHFDSSEWNAFNALGHTPLVSFLSVEILIRLAIWVIVQLSWQRAPRKLVYAMSYEIELWAVICRSAPCHFPTRGSNDAHQINASFTHRWVALPIKYHACLISHSVISNSDSNSGSEKFYSRRVPK